MKLIFIFIKDMIKYIFSNEGTKEEKKCLISSFNKIFIITIFSTITAPIIWPIYYMMRKYIFNKINAELYLYDTNEIFDLAKKKLNFIEYFIFLYGDKYSPKCEKLPDFFIKKYKILPWFWKYFIFSAIRNTFFNYRYYYFMTKNEVIKSSKIKVIIDERTNSKIHSDGITSVNSGKHFFWRNDIKGNPYFCYRNNTSKTLFYIEYCGLEDLHKYPSLYCRLEASLRKY